MAVVKTMAFKANTRVLFVVFMVMLIADYVDPIDHPSLAPVTRSRKLVFAAFLWARNEPWFQKDGCEHQFTATPTERNGGWRSVADRGRAPAPVSGPQTPCQISVHFPGTGTG
jgi:hypothetical protein